MRRVAGTVGNALRGVPGSCVRWRDVRASVTPGPAYFFPYGSFEEMKSATMIEKMTRGPVGLLTVRPSGPPAMGKSLVQWFLYCVVISIFAAYLSGRLLTPGTAFLQVFRVVGTVAWLGYGAAHVQESIWSGRSWVVTLKHLFDSMIYALLTAGTFAWLWPKSI